MIDYTDLKIKILQEKEGNAIVEIEPFARGYGYTLGNSIRRALLSSIEGAAVTSIKLADVQHEYSTIPGMLEDVLNFTLNLRGIAFIVHSDLPQTLVLKASGEGEVKASNIELNQEVEIKNPDYVIAHLTDKKAKLEVEMVVEKGFGFRHADEQKRSEIGVIPLDANFSPVKKVGFKVSSVRVGQRTDFDKITLDLHLKENTNARRAIYEAAKYIADGYVRIIKALNEEYEDENVIYSDDFNPDTQEMQTITLNGNGTKNKKNGNNGVDLSMVRIEEMNVSGRVIKALKSKGIETVDKLVELSEPEVKSLKGMGNASMRELKEALEKLGAYLKS